MSAAAPASRGAAAAGRPAAAAPPGVLRFGDDVSPALGAQEPPQPSLLRLPEDVERASVLISLSCGAVGALALGVFMLFVGARGAALPCEVPLARFALVDGSLSLVLAALQAVLAVSMLPAAAATRGSLRGAWLVLSAGVLVALVVVALAVRVWGTALAFGGGLWTRMALAESAVAAATAAVEAAGSSMAGSYPCDPTLYNPAAIFLLVVWSLVALAAAFGCCVCCCIVVGAGCFYACCEAGRRGGRGPWGRATAKRASDDNDDDESSGDDNDDAEAALVKRKARRDVPAPIPPPVFA